MPIPGVKKELPMAVDLLPTECGGLAAESGVKDGPFFSEKMSYFGCLVVDISLRQPLHSTLLKILLASMAGKICAIAKMQLRIAHTTTWIF